MKGSYQKITFNSTWKKTFSKPCICRILPYSYGVHHAYSPLADAPTLKSGRHLFTTPMWVSGVDFRVHATLRNMVRRAPQGDIHPYYLKTAFEWHLCSLKSLWCSQVLNLINKRSIPITSSYWLLNNLFLLNKLHLYDNERENRIISQWSPKVKVN